MLEAALSRSFRSRFSSFFVIDGKKKVHLTLVVHFTAKRSLERQSLNMKDINLSLFLWINHLWLFLV